MHERDELVGLERAHRAQAGQLGEALVERDPRAQGLDLAGVEPLPQPERVLTLDAEARMEDPLGPVAVVGQQEHPLGVLVEPADRIEPGTLRHERRRQQFEHGPVRVTVAGGRGDAGRLVQQQVGLRGRRRR